MALRARTREINIFNMSLLDILCGALGAFCFMMLVLLPFYRPGLGGFAQAQRNREEAEQLIRDMQKLKERLAAGDTSAQQDLEEMIRRLEAQLKELEGQVNDLTAKNDELTKENTDLTKQRDDFKRSLDNRRPFLVFSQAMDALQDVDLYVQDENAKVPPFDPTQARHKVYWNGDVNVYAASVSSWLVRDSPVNYKYRVYVNLVKKPPQRGRTLVKSIVSGDNFAFALPDADLTPERYWAFLGRLQSDDKGKLSFAEASASERDAEWTRVMKTAPPTAAPAKSAAPAASASAPPPMTNDERRAMLERLRKLREQPAATPHP